MRSTRQLLFALLGPAVFAAALLGVSTAASAHDAAESTSPAQGGTVATAPEKVSVTFSKNPLGIGAQFSVKDSTGAEWADGAVDIVDNVASQKLKSGAPAGAYTVAWRVVSSDSHPIEGTFRFTASAAAAGAQPAGASPSGGSPGTGTTAAPAVPSMGTAQPGATATPLPAVNASEPFPWSLVVFAAVALGLLVAIGILAKRRLTGDSEDDAGSEDEAGPDDAGPGTDGGQRP